MAILDFGLDAWRRCRNEYTHDEALEVRVVADLDVRLVDGAADERELDAAIETANRSRR